MKAFPNYRYNTVHIASIYQAEKTLFGISCPGRRCPYAQRVLAGSHIADGFGGCAVGGILSCAGYRCPWLFRPFSFLRNKEWFARYTLSFLIVNLLGFCHLLCLSCRSALVCAAIWLQVQSSYPRQCGGPGAFRQLLSCVGLFRFVCQELQCLCRDAFAACFLSADRLVLWAKVPVGRVNALFALIMVGYLVCSGV
jgi:hypothetical protein